MQENRVSFEFKNRLSELDRLREKLEELGQSLGVPKKNLLQIILAMEEMCTNIISHGYVDEDEHVIKIIIWCKGKTLNLRVEDDGIPFNPIELEDPDLECPIEDREVGGLGCYFMRCLMDEVEYKRLGSNNVLTMKKDIYET